IKHPRSSSAVASARFMHFCIYVTLGFLLFNGTESRKCSTEEGVKEHEVCEFVLDFLHDTCDIKDFYSRGRTKILQEKEGCNITVLDSDATRVVCSCYSGDFCTEKLRILEVFNEEKFESKSGLNYSQCLQLALRKGPFLPIERFRETGEGERNSSGEEAKNYPKKFASFASVRGKKNWNVNEDSHSQPCTLKKTILTTVIMISGAAFLLLTVALLAASYLAFRDNDESVSLMSTRSRSQREDYE
uniref:Conserved plasma membrane protein n=1 Tax=Haemonchus contortus TaxID=6289 RepID=A0A7I4YYE4_HAECO